MFKTMWQGLGRGARAGLVGSVVLVAALTVAVAAWLLRTDYQVLFANLSPQDAGAMTAELERMKVPYRLGEGGSSILVDADSVHKTRIKLMAKDLPLHGTVGFELFNNADFGMTEFAQKINYQRALQGEITRTILSLSEIDSARVHLALPEEGMFKRASGRAKASITLALRHGQSLRPEQVSGIQRLVSAAVPSIQTQDVTIVDQHGVALTRPAAGDSETEWGSGRLDLKKETETYLGRKAAAVLERTFGTGQAMASVDVTLNMDQVRVTTEDVVGAPGRGGQAGVVVRERQTLSDAGAPLDAKAHEGASGNSQREVEYQVGRRVQQVVSAPGAIRALRVVAVVHKMLDAEQAEQVRKMVFAAVGGAEERGDVVVIQGQEAWTGDAAATPELAAPREPAPAPSAMQDGAHAAPAVVEVLALLLALAVGAAVGLLARRPRRQPPALSAEQRQAALERVQAWLSHGDAGRTPTQLEEAAWKR